MSVVVTPQHYHQRRAALLAQIENNSVVLICAAKEVTRSHDTEYPFRQNSDFFYYTGFPEPEAVLILTKDTAGHCNELLLCRDKDPVAEVWQGRRYGAKAACQHFAIATANLSELDTQLRQAVNGTEHLYYYQGHDTDFEQQLTELLISLRRTAKRGDKAPAVLHDLRPFSSEQRLLKDEAEISLMRQAAVISAEAHCRAMRYASAGCYEYQLEAEILHHFMLQGARFPAYNTIVGSGENGCILHYTENSSQIADGTLVLIDAGCELHGYAADITRTFPVNGRFNPQQAALYQVVLNAQYAACAAVKPGNSFADVTSAAVDELTKGLLALNILHGDLTQLITDMACRQYLIHGIGHWLGLDVHDVGAYKTAGQDRPFSPGMVLTIEPGLYIPSGSDTDEKWWGLGIRIEDNLLVTVDGHDNLTCHVPKEIADIEVLMQQH